MRLPTLFLSAAAAVIWGSNKWLKVRKVNIKLKNLPVDELKILQISDLHSNDVHKKNLNIWSDVNKLDFDMAVITGDIINMYPEELTPHLNEISALAERKPTFFSVGNHDLLAGKGLLDVLRKTQVVILNNKRARIIKDGQYITVVGANFPYKATQNKLLAENGFKIVLTHSPDSFEVFKHYQPDLVLSGHVHGGQLRLPFIKTLISPDCGIFPKYGYGLYRFLDSQLFVSKGIGHTHFPIRFWNRPEIVLFTLSKK